jgi:RNA polymerase sigma-70 factor, ECF subfamily
LEPLRRDLYAYCRQLTGNAFDAEDLVQESLTRAFTQAAQAHSPIEKPRAWLFRVATNAYVDGYRRQHPVPAELPERPAPPSPRTTYRGSLRFCWRTRTARSSAY